MRRFQKIILETENFQRESPKTATVNHINTAISPLSRCFIVMPLLALIYFKFLQINYKIFLVTMLDMA